jgi:GT2 family glycosyltransferase
MLLGWEYIKNKAFDYLFVFNDDVFFYNNTFDILLNTSQKQKNSLVSGAICDPISKEISYGGYSLGNFFYPLRLKRNKDLSENNFLDTCNMNALIIPKSVLVEYGFLSPIFRHSIADIEFGLRIGKVGHPILMTSKVVGECSRNSPIGTSEEMGISSLVKLRRFNSIKEQPFSSRWYFYKNYGGPFWYITFWIVYIKILLLNY